MSIKIVKNQNGIGLVETILALGIAIVVITALVSLAVYTLRSSQQSKYLLEGSKLASEQVELVRLGKDASATWLDFYNLMNTCSSKDCTADGTGAINDNPAPTDKQITLSNGANVDRFFRATIIDNNTVRITSTVQWKVGPSVKKTTVVTDITNWRNR